MGASVEMQGGGGSAVGVVGSRPMDISVQSRLFLHCSWARIGSTYPLQQEPTKDQRGWGAPPDHPGRACSQPNLSLPRTAFRKPSEQRQNSSLPHVRRSASGLPRAASPADGSLCSQSLESQHTTHRLK